MPALKQQKQATATCTYTFAAAVSVRTCCAMYRAALGPLPSPRLMSAVTLLVVSSLMMGMRAVRMMISFLMGILRYLHPVQCSAVNSK